MFAHIYIHTRLWWLVCMCYAMKCNRKMSLNCGWRRLVCLYLSRCIFSLLPIEWRWHHHINIGKSLDIDRFINVAGFNANTWSMVLIADQLRRLFLVSWIEHQKSYANDEIAWMIVVYIFTQLLMVICKKQSAGCFFDEEFGLASYSPCCIVSRTLRFR